MRWLWIVARAFQASGPALDVADAHIPGLTQMANAFGSDVRPSLSVILNWQRTQIGK